MNLQPLLALGTAAALAFGSASVLAQSAGPETAGASKAGAVEKDPKAKARAKAESMKLAASDRQAQKSVVPTGAAAAIDSASGTERYKSCAGKASDL